jgi:protein-tyrosine phosphatase
MLPGAVNLRDFGGYATEDGRMVRRHRLYRSGALAHLSEEAQHAFAELGINLICDLRRQEEKEEEPSPIFRHSPRQLEIPIFPGSALRMSEQSDQSNQSNQGEPAELTLAQRIDFMVTINRELARDHAEDYARMFEALLEEQEGGFLVHCSAGKDRTGFACALILHALGVPEQTVLEDYLLTNTALDFEGYILPRLMARYGHEVVPDRETIMALAGVRPEYLRGAYEAIEAEFEGVEHYIEEAIGLDASALRTLRSRLVE